MLFLFSVEQVGYYRYIMYIRGFELEDARDRAIVRQVNQVIEFGMAGVFRCHWYSSFVFCFLQLKDSTEEPMTVLRWQRKTPEQENTNLSRRTA